MQNETFQITGMSCQHCVRAVDQALSEIDGVETDEVSIGEAKVRYDDSKVNRLQLVEAIQEAGFELAS
jgi:copper chaperone